MGRRYRRIYEPTEREAALAEQLADMFDQRLWDALSDWGRDLLLDERAIVEDRTTGDDRVPGIPDDQQEAAYEELHDAAVGRIVQAFVYLQASGEPEEEPT